MILDRRSVIEKTKKEYTNEAKEKADREYVDRLVKAMDVCRKYGLL